MLLYREICTELQKNDLYGNKELPKNLQIPHQLRISQLCPLLSGNVSMSMPPQPCLHIQSNQDDFSSVERSKHLQESFPLHQSNALEYKQKIKRIPMTALLRLTLLPQSKNGHTTPNFLELGTPLKARSRKALVFRTHS